jgi:hypothetical protein
LAAGTGDCKQKQQLLSGIFTLKEQRQQIDPAAEESADLLAVLTCFAR